METEKGKDKFVIKKPPKFNSRSKLTLCLAEILGTGLLLFMGCLGCITDVDLMPLPHHLSSIAFGLSVMTIIQLFGHISGAHLNPQVTMASALFRVLDLSLVPYYIVSQFIGAVLGFGLLRILVPYEYIENEKFDVLTNHTVHSTGLCSTVPHEKISTIQALAFEITLTCILILTCGAVWDKRNENKPDSLPLRFGFIIVVIGMIAGPYTGASMNTARSFAPALFNGDWNYHWIYWVGPTIGALLGAGIYITVFSPAEEENYSNEDEQHRLETVVLNEKLPDHLQYSDR